MSPRLSTRVPSRSKMTPRMSFLRAQLAEELGEGGPHLRGLLVRGRLGHETVEGVGRAMVVAGAHANHPEEEEGLGGVGVQLAQPLQFLRGARLVPADGEQE